MKLIKSPQFIDNIPKYLEFKTLAGQNIWVAFDDNKLPIGAGFSKDQAKHSIGQSANVSFGKPDWLYEMGNTDPTNTNHEIYSVPVKIRNHFDSLMSINPVMPLIWHPVINKTTNELCLITTDVLNLELPSMYFTTPREKTDTIFSQMERCLFQVYIKMYSEPTTEKTTHKHNNLLLYWFAKWYDSLEVIKTL